MYKVQHAKSKNSQIGSKVTKRVRDREGRFVAWEDSKFRVQYVHLLEIGFGLSAVGDMCVLGELRVVRLRSDRMVQILRAFFIFA